MKKTIPSHTRRALLAATLLGLALPGLADDGALYDQILTGKR
jgi:uncharacterized membrane protein